VTIRRAEPGEFDALVEIWRRSVTATHTFLTPREIATLLPVVRQQALPALDLWVLCDADGTRLGFLGMEENSIEALFLAPEAMRRGHGRRLVEHARRLRAGARLKVDVNEQNPGALKFCQACGFEVVGRSPVDSAGRPYPILHLEETPRP
jgi:putative acetyltransferase